jgi:hypothetical protein
MADRSLDDLLARPHIQDLLFVLAYRFFLVRSQASKFWHPSYPDVLSHPEEADNGAGRTYYLSDFIHVDYDAPLPPTCVDTARLDLRHLVKVGLVKQRNIQPLWPPPPELSGEASLSYSVPALSDPEDP